MDTNPLKKLFVRQHFTVMALIVLSSITSPLQAATGSFLGGWGTNNRALGGAGVAFAEDAMSIASNPSSAIALPADSFTLGVTLLKSAQSLRGSAVDTSTAAPGAFAIAEGKRWSDHDVPAEIDGVFPIPFIAANWLIDDQHALGLAVFGNGGMSVNYKGFENPNCPSGTPKSGYLCFGNVGSDVLQLYISPTWAYKVNDQLSIGISPLLIYQSIEIEGLTLFSARSRQPEKFSNQGHSDAWGYGLKIGATFKATDALTLGFTGQTRGNMQKHKEYAGLFPGQGKFDVPPYIHTGIAWQLLPNTTVLLDYQRIFFSKIKAIGNSGNSTGLYGDLDGPGFGWENSRTWRLGLRYEANDDLTLRFGLSDNNDIVPSNEILNNIVSAALFDEHFSLGATWKLKGGEALDIAFIYAKRQKLSGQNPLFPEQRLSTENGLYTLDIGWRTNF